MGERFPKAVGRPPASWRAFHSLAASIARFLGRVPDHLLNGAHGCADVFAMLCRNRWAGLEQEGFGIVFVEAAAAGVPQVAGNSGGAAEAVDVTLAFLVGRNPSVSKAKGPTSVFSMLKPVSNEYTSRRSVFRVAAARRSSLVESSLGGRSKRLMRARSDTIGNIAIRWKSWSLSMSRVVSTQN